MAYFTDFKRVYEEFNVLMPFSADVKLNKGLPLEFWTFKSQILSGSQISSLHYTFIRCYEQKPLKFLHTLVLLLVKMIIASRVIEAGIGEVILVVGTINVLWKKLQLPSRWNYLLLLSGA